MKFECAGCGRKDKAIFRTNPKGEKGIFKCRPCIDGHPRISLGQDRELLDALAGVHEPEMRAMQRRKA